MAINFFVIFKEPINWEDINEDIYPFMPEMEFFPISSTLRSGNELGISMPGKFLDSKSWSKFQLLYKLLKNRHTAEIYDLFSGQLITQDNLMSFRELFS